MHSQSHLGQVGGALGGDDHHLPSFPPLAADAGALGRHSVSLASVLGFHQAAHLCRTIGLALRRAGAIC